MPSKHTKTGRRRSSTSFASPFEGEAAQKGPPQGPGEGEVGEREAEGPYSMIFHVSVTLDSFESEIEKIVRAGFHPEVRMTDIDHLLRVPMAEVERYGHLIRERSLGVFAHGPYLGLDIASLNAHLAEHSAECLERGLEVAAAIGARVMVMHTNYSPFYSRGGLREWLGNWSARMPGVLDAARRRGVTIAVENAWEENPRVLEHLVDLLGPGGAGVCLDAGHVTAFSRLSIGRWWETLGDRVVALHLHDNDGLSDDHLAPGKGIVDFSALVGLLRSRRELPLMTFEVDLASAVEGRRHLERLFAEQPRERG